MHLDREGIYATVSISWIKCKKIELVQVAEFFASWANSDDLIPPDTLHLVKEDFSIKAVLVIASQDLLPYIFNKASLSHAFHQDTLGEKLG